MRKYLYLFSLLSHSALSYFALCEIDSVKIYKVEPTLQNQFNGHVNNPQVFPVDLAYVKRAKWEKGILEFFSDENRLIFSLHTRDFEKIKIDFALDELLIQDKKDKMPPLDLMFFKLGAFYVQGSAQGLNIHVWHTGSEGLSLNLNPVMQTLPLTYWDKIKFFFNHRFPYLCFLGTVLYIASQELWEYYY